MFWVLFYVLVVHICGLKADDNFMVNHRKETCAIIGSDCTSCGYGYVSCGLDFCYNPTVGEICCSGSYVCPPNSQCSSNDNLCCAPGSSPDQCTEIIIANTTVSRTLTLISITVPVTITSTRTSTLTRTITSHTASSSNGGNSGSNESVGTNISNTTTTTMTIHTTVATPTQTITSLMGGTASNMSINTNSSISLGNATDSQNASSILISAGMSLNLTATSEPAETKSSTPGNLSTSLTTPTTPASSSTNATHSEASRKLGCTMIGLIVLGLVVVSNY